MCVVVLSSWKVERFLGRVLHGQLEDQGVAGEKELVLRNHWASRCPAGTDCPLGSAEPQGQEERKI